MKNLRFLKKALSFTLIEIVTVIAIISILIALLLPALRNAKLKALDLKCASNQRQIHMAIVMYCSDHDNIYMKDIAFNAQWQQLLLLSNYVQNKFDFFRCPLSDGDVSPSQTWWTDYSTTIDGTTQWTEYKVNDSAELVNKVFGTQLRPLKVVIVMDAIDWLPRHRNKTSGNLCFFDGRVEMMTWDQYNGPEPSRSGPTNWYNWGLVD